MNKIPMTAEGYTKLQEELKNLVNKHLPKDVTKKKHKYKL